MAPIESAMDPAPFVPGTALVLAAHGSRQEPAALRSMEECARKIRSLGVFDEVLSAFHQGEPSFASVLDLVRATDVVVVPFLAADGHYARSVLPRELARNRTGGSKSLRIAEAVGTHPAMALLAVRRVLELAHRSDLDPGRIAVAVVGHGTVRDPRSRRATEDMVEVFRASRRFAAAAAFFLDEEPGPEEIARRLDAETVLVLPFLMGAGRHALGDIPRRCGSPLPPAAALPHVAVQAGRRIIFDEALGSRPEVVGIVLARALEARGPRRAMRGRGSVAIVGAGPGDPGLLTVRGRELLGEADVVVHDRLIAWDLLAHTRPGAEIIDLGKASGIRLGSQEEIHAVLLERARAGRMVVRLKGGDPFVFGRGWEEVRACRSLGIPCEVVPGVSSALAVPARASIPLTLRGVGRSFAVVTARTEDDSEPDYEALARIDTVVFLMGRARLGEILERLVDAGRASDTPAACIERGTTPEERSAVGTLGDLAALADAQGLESPVVIVVGEVVRCAAEIARPGPTGDSLREVANSLLAEGD